MGLSCPSYPLAQVLPPPLILQCLLQRACSSSSILGCSEEGCHTNQHLAFCRQREHSWHSNQPKQLLHCFSGTGGGWSLQWNWSFSAGMKEATRHHQGYCPTAPSCHSQRSSLFKIWVLALLSLSSSAQSKLMGMLSCSWGVLSSQYQRTPADKKAIAWSELWEADIEKEQIPANIYVQGHKTIGRQPGLFNPWQIRVGGEYLKILFLIQSITGIKTSQASQ